ncbi:MAG: multidrug transporter MATE, partial [Rhodobacteraceae bacterium]|nr:multidrug transporter MATE [Paracoccaceae bacterium]
MGHVARMALTGTVGFMFIFAVDAMNLFWLSKVGQSALVAAAGFAFSVQVLGMATGISMMIAATALVSRSVGAGDGAAAKAQATGAAIWAAVTQMGVAAVLVGFRHPILAALGAEGEVAAAAARYLAFSLPSLTLLGAAMVMNGAIRAIGDARRSVAVTMGGGVMSLLLDPIMIYGLGLGLDGAAVGVNVSRIVILLLAFRIARTRHDLVARPRWRDVRAVLRPFAAI